MLIEFKWLSRSVARWNWWPSD